MRSARPKLVAGLVPSSRLLAAATGLLLALAVPALAQTRVTTDPAAPPNILSTSQPAAGVNTAPATATPKAGPNAGSVAGPAQPSTALPPSAAVPSVGGTPDKTRIAFMEDVKTDQPASSTEQKVRGRFADIVRVTDPKIRDNVAIEGNIRYEPLPDKSGQRAVVTWSQVVRTDETDKKKALATPLQSAFRPLEKTVTAGQAVNAQGDVAGAISAAEALFAEEKKKEDGTTNTKQPDQQAKMSSGSGQAAASKNDMFKDISVPNGSGITVNPAAEAVAGTTTEGCPMKIDLAQGIAIEQSRVTSNGTPSGDCSDDGTHFPILKSYVGCPDKVDTENKVAYAQFRNYFTKADGTSTYISDDCVPDTETGFALSNDPSGCTTETDIPNLKAYLRSELVYTNKQGQRVVVEGCRRTPGADAITMSQTADGCTIRNDFQAGKSIRQLKVVYTDAGGALFQVSGCNDSTNPADTFVQQKDYAACQPIVSLSTMTATKQYRLFITPPEGKTFVSECTPDADGALVIQESTEGCETVFFHDLAAGVSYGASRFRYQDGSEVKYVNDSCQKSTVTYQQQSETQGYEYHDAQLYAYPKDAIYINAPSGRVDVSPALVRDGAPQLAYVLKTEKDISDPATPPTYQGCDKYVTTLHVKTYTRPDATTYDYAVGAGATVGPTNVCVSTLMDTQRITFGWRWYLDQPATGSDVGSNWKGWGKHAMQEDVQKFQNKNTETGTIISTSCAMMHNRWDYYQGGVIATIPSTSSQQTWNYDMQVQFGAIEAQTLAGATPCPY